MKWFVLIFLLVVCFIGTGEAILGGDKTKINEYPWLALIEYNETYGSAFYCLGALIDRDYVLTASHCVSGKHLSQRGWTLTGVRLGEWNTSSDPDCDEGQCSDAVVNIPVVEQIPHEKYEPNSRLQLNDIALLRLARPVQYTNWIKPIPLPTVSDVNKNFDGVPLIASGWGTTEHAARSDIKLKVKLNGTSLDKCNVLYSGYGVTLTNLHLCAGGEKGKDSCKGDNGGPLIHENKSDPKNVQYSIVGVASFGSSPCGLKDVPGVYTRVDQYIDWISNHMNKQENR